MGHGDLALKYMPRLAFMHFLYSQAKQLRGVILEIALLYVWCCFTYIVRASMGGDLRQKGFGLSGLLGV